MSHAPPCSAPLPDLLSWGAAWNGEDSESSCTQRNHARSIIIFLVLFDVQACAKRLHDPHRFVSRNIVVVCCSLLQFRGDPVDTVHSHRLRYHCACFPNTRSSPSRHFRCSGPPPSHAHAARDQIPHFVCWKQISNTLQAAHQQIQPCQIVLDWPFRL